MLVALIDDGIETSFVPDGIVQYDLSVDLDGQIQSRKTEHNILTDHGTVCAKIIAKYAPSVKFCSLRIFNETELNASCTQLVSALNWCLEQKIPIIHLSIGSSKINDYKEIRPIIAKLIKNNHIIVAACSNKSLYTIPAYISGVFSVSADPHLSDCNYIINNDIIGSIFKASSRHTLSMLPGNTFLTPVANSYAAPTITSVIYNILINYPEFSLSFMQLYRKLTKCNTIYPFLLKPDFIDNALIINEYKYPLLRQHYFFNCIGELTSRDDLLKFDLRKCDIIYLPPSDNDSENLKITHKERYGVFNNLLYGGLKNKNFDCIIDNLVWYEHPIINQNDLSCRQLDGLCPIIYIYGTDLQTIDLTCRLRNLFVKDNYQCISISDFPFSYLYGLEYISDSLNLYNSINFVSYFYNPDVIICSICTKDFINLLHEDNFYIFINDKYLNSQNSSLNVINFPLNYNYDYLLMEYNKICKYFS